MRKILSFILAAAMLLSVMIIVSVPAAAVDGEWTTYATPTDYGTNDDGTPKTPVIAGYEYTSEGFTTVDADWTGRSPFVTVQTKNKVNIEDGVYLKVCVDRYAYEGNDAWINFNFWDSQNIKPGSAGYGKGVQTLIRPARDQADADNKVPYDESDWYYTQVEWWKNEWNNAGTTPFKDADGKETTVPVIDGKVTFEVELKHENGAYTLSINGAQATEDTMTTFASIFADGEAYVGITLNNSTYDSVVGLTILEFGTCKEDAIAPDGTDYKEPVNAPIEEIAEIADPSTVADGMPAILMTGNKEDSDTKSISAGQGDTYTTNENFSVRVADTNGDQWNSTMFKVKNDVSYDIDDFPVLGFLVKNFCNCEDPTFCYATEECNAYIMAGKGRAPASGGCMLTPVIDICMDTIYIEEGENAGQYLYFWYDTSSDNAIKHVGGEDSNSNWTGRIHGVQMEFQKLSPDATRNIITFEWVGFFRTPEEIEAYAFSYLGIEMEEDTTEAPEDDSTEAGVADTTEADVADTTEAPVDQTTEAKGEEKTEAPTKAPENETPAPADGGCGSVIGAGAFAVVALVATAGAVVLKKKED